MKLFSHILLGLGVALAQVSSVPPQYPDWPLSPTPEVKPAPKAEVIDQLPAGRLYVVQHNGEACQLLVSPPQAASIRQYKDAVTIDGVFADGNGQAETRDYKAKQIFVVKRLQQGRFELLKVPAGAVERKVLGDGDVVPVPPKPVEPTPVVDPSPWNNAPGLRVLFVYPSNANLPPGQDSIINGGRVRNALRSACVKVDGDPQYFIWPSNADVSSVSPEWKKAFAIATAIKEEIKVVNGVEKKVATPFTAWVVLGSGVKWESIPLPASPDEMLKILGKYQ